MNIEKILSCICLSTLVVAGISLGLGSWLELDNNLFHSPGDHKYTLINVDIINQHNNRITLFIGLWRYAVYYHPSGLHLSSIPRFNYSLDLPSILYQALDYRNQPTTQLDSLSLHPTSLSFLRFVLLVMSTVLSVISVLIVSYVLISYSKKKASNMTQVPLGIVHMISLINICLISVSLGVTYSQYTSSIQRICSLLQSSFTPSSQDSVAPPDYYFCDGYTRSNEIVLLGLAIGLYTLDIVFSLLTIPRSRYYIMNKLNLDTPHPHQHPTLYQDKLASALNILPQTKECTPAEKSKFTVIDGNIPVALRPPPLSSGSIRRNGSQKRINRPTLTSTATSDTNIHSEPTLNLTHQHPIITTAHVRPHTTSPGLTTPMEEKTYFSSHSSLSMYEDILLPPKLPFANRSSDQTAMGRPLSHGSNNTFGAELTHSEHNGSNASQDDVSGTFDHNRSSSITSNHHSTVVSHPHPITDDMDDINSSNESIRREQLNKRIRDYRTISFT